MFTLTSPKSWIAGLVTAALLALAICGCHRGADLARDPMAIYLTWQRDPATTMTIQWIGNAKPDGAHVLYRAEGQKEWQQASGFDRPLPQGHDDKHVYIVELTGLSPYTIYHFKIAGAEGEDKFRTMPSHLDRPIRFVVGGDMFHETPEMLQDANRLAAKKSPMFAVAGGDLAYASVREVSGLEDYERWMEFMIRWSEDMVTPEGLKVPLLAVLGNHDVNGRYLQPPSSAKFYYTLFTMPGKQGYNVLDFGDYMTFIMLDSEHTHPIEGAQTQWLEETLAARQRFPNKFAAYHVPAYPSVRTFDGKYNPLIRANWVPLFEKYGLNISFEHHEHAYKRTHPIKAGKVDPNGVVYIGDGAWGTTPRPPRTPAERWYLAHTAQAQHVLLVEITPKERHVTAFDVPTGKAIDELRQAVGK
jgi:hypothetical protein